jgi:hypothetical protein
MNKLKDILVTTLLSYNIDIDHEYLHLSEEARLEHLAYVSSDKNQDIVNDMLLDIGHSSSSSSSSSSSRNDVIIVSVGTSSTQCCNSNGVLGYYYIGSDAILHSDHSLAIELLNKIKDIINNNDNIDNNIPIVFINSISKVINRTLYFDQSYTNDDLLIYINNNSKNDSNNDSNNNILQLLILILNHSKLIDNPIIISTSNIDNSWSIIKLQELHSVYRDTTSHLFFIDFGGGGINLKYHNLESKETRTIAKNRMLLTYGQDKFINEVLNDTMKDSPIFESMITFISNSIIAFAKDNDIINDKYYLKIIQTGKARQYAYLGHSEPTI